jgi:hypothetical protein
MGLRTRPAKPEMCMLSRVEAQYACAAVCSTNDCVVGRVLCVMLSRTTQPGATKNMMLQQQ